MGQRSAKMADVHLFAPPILVLLLVYLCSALILGTHNEPHCLEKQYVYVVAAEEHATPEPVQRSYMICPNRKRRYFKQRISYYSNHVACFSINKPLVNVHPNPGPGRNGNKNHLVNCLYLNARSLVHKMDELQTLAIGVDLIAVTETWLKPTQFWTANSSRPLTSPSTDGIVSRKQGEEYYSQSGTPSLASGGGISKATPSQWYANFDRTPGASYW